MSNRTFAGAVLLALLLLVALPLAALAAGSEPTSLTIAVPPSASLGQVALARVTLTDATGQPIPKATILLTAPLSFLQGSGDVVIADATTDAKGVAIAEFDIRTEGALAIKAVFAGDERYAASSASATVSIAGDGQLYAQAAGVQLPGLNTSPGAIFSPAGSGQANVGVLPGLAALWPALSGWPIALALMTIWSFYAMVAGLLFRIGAAANEAEA